MWMSNRVLKNDLECGGLTPLSIRPAKDIGEITKNHACNQSGVKPPHSKIYRRSSLELSLSAGANTPERCLRGPMHFALSALNQTTIAAPGPRWAGLLPFAPSALRMKLRF
jgi:hypothetical protein